MCVSLIALSLYQWHIQWQVSECINCFFFFTAVVKLPTGVRQLNFARLLISYTKRFALTDPREALQYYYLLKVERKHVQLAVH